MPMLEGLDGVQKMSKSLGNYVGITEAPQEMFGKLMSISDELMWRYYELLTDVSMAAIEQMKREVAAGQAHPMKLKQDLAGRIVTDFHGAEAAARAADDWSRQFQRDEVPEEVEEVTIKFDDVLPIPASEVEWSISGEMGAQTVKSAVRRIPEFALTASWFAADLQARCQKHPERSKKGPSGLGTMLKNRRTSW